MVEFRRGNDIRTVGVQTGVVTEVDTSAANAAVGEAIQTGIQTFKTIRAEMVAKDVESQAKDVLASLEERRAAVRSGEAIPGVSPEAANNPQFQSAERQMDRIKGALSSGAITATDANIRIRAITNEALANNPFIARDLQRSLQRRGLIGGGGGTGGGSALPTLTPEEKAEEQQRQEIAKLASEFQVTIPQAQKIALNEKRRASLIADIEFEEKLEGRQDRLTVQKQDLQFNQLANERYINLANTIAAGGIQNPTAQKAALDGLLFEMQTRISTEIRDQKIQADQIANWKNRIDAMKVLIDNGKFDQFIRDNLDSFNAQTELDVKNADPFGYSVYKLWGADVYLRHLDEQKLAVKNPTLAAIISKSTTYNTIAEMAASRIGYTNGKQTGEIPETAKGRDGHLINAMGDLVEPKLGDESKKETLRYMTKLLGGEEPAFVSITDNKLLNAEISKNPSGPVAQDYRNKFSSNYTSSFSALTTEAASQIESFDGAGFKIKDNSVQLVDTLASVPDKLRAGIPRETSGIRYDPEQNRIGVYYTRPDKSGKPIETFEIPKAEDVGVFSSSYTDAIAQLNKTIEATEKFQGTPSVLNLNLGAKEFGKKTFDDFVKRLQQSIKQAEEAEEE